PSVVVELNRAVAIAMCDGPEHGLRIVDELFTRGALALYPLAHSARADLLRRLGRREESRAAYESALALTNEDSQQRYLRRRIAEVSA
ncbi:MAG: RNA polymerase subunit sigma-24, partial [Gemmatimonadaceae bacterium]